MANAVDWGLTAQGFRRPSYTEILDAFEYQTREKFTEDGKTPNLTVRSPLGIFLRIWAWIANLLFQLLEDIYNNQFIDTAVGASLYQLGRNIGLRLLPAQRASGEVDVTGAPGTLVPAGFLVGTIAGIQYAVQLPGTISPEGSVTVPIQCTEYGVLGNVDKGTVSEIINPLEGIHAVINSEEIKGGRTRETDEQYRDRYYKSVDFAGGVNADAIQAEILQKVEGVLSAKVYENDTDQEDARGLPPHSIEAVVYAGLDHKIAQAIYRRKAGGIQTHGGKLVEVISPQNGQVYAIRFTRPAPIPIWVKLEQLQVDPVAFPIDGVRQLQAALGSFIGSDISSGLGIGESVIFNKLPGAIYGVSGVIDFSLSIGHDGSVFGRDNITISEREKAVTDADKIVVLLSTPLEEAQA